jgi:site-specific recombinase XerC
MGKRGKLRTKLLNDEEKIKLLDTVQKMNPDDWPIFWLMEYRGLRIGEIVSDHREGSRLVVNNNPDPDKAKEWGAGWKNFKSNLPGLLIEDLTESGIHVVGKYHHDDFIFLPKNIIEKLRVLAGKREKGLIFNSVGSYKDPVGTMDKRSKRYACQAGIEDWQYYHPHASRHDFGYKMAELTEGDVFKVRDFCRHKGIGMSSVYVHKAPPEKLRQILVTMDEA